MWSEATIVDDYIESMPTDQKQAIEIVRSTIPAGSSPGYLESTGSGKP